MGSKGDVDISGGGGGEPRDDYAPMSSVLSTDFPVFDDGAGEIEEIPGGLPSDGTLYYFQSSYVFNTFPGTDGFFGFSNDSTYPFEGRKDTYVEVVAAGDWFVDYATNRIYSYLDNLADSYVHMCEQDITYIGGGVYSYHYGSTITFIEFDGTTLGIADVIRCSINEVGFLGNSKILMDVTLRVAPATDIQRLVRSLDGGATWALCSPNLTNSPVSGFIPCPKDDPKRLYFVQFSPTPGWWYTSDLINFTNITTTIGSDFGAAPIWEDIPGLKDFARLRVTGSSGSRTYYIDEWDTGGDTTVKTMPAGSWFHGGANIHEIDTLAFEVIGVGWFDAYVMCSRGGGAGPLGYNWSSTSWKGQLYYWIPGAFDDGVGWKASDDPDFADYEDIVVFSEIEQAGVVMIARFNANGAYNGTWPPVAIEQPLEYYYKMYVSQDLGQSYTHVATLDQFPDGSPINRAFDTTFAQPNNRRYKHSNVIKVNDAVTGEPGFVVHGLESQGFDGGGFPTGELSVWYFTISGQWTWLSNQIDFADWSNPAQVDRFMLSLNIPIKTDTIGARDENGTYPGVYPMSRFAHNGIHKLNNGKLRIVGPTGGALSQAYFRILDFDPPSFEFYTATQIVASSAGFTIRAPHINELRQKLLHLNANVQTGGTNHVMFGIDVSDLVTVAANKTSVRAEHYSICKREHDKVAGQVGSDPGTAYYNTGDSLVDIMAEAPTPVADGTTAPSIRTLIAMRKILQELYSNGWFCACYSYCPCQTFVDIEISGGKK